MSPIETLDDSTRNRRREVSESAAKRFHPSIRAILASEGGKKPRIIATCMLLRVDCRNYMVTAAHVVDELDDSALYVAGSVGSQPVQLIGVVHKTAAPPQGRQKDKIDVAFWEIDEQKIPELGNVAFIEATQISHNRAPLKNRLYLAAGYPYSRNKRNVKNNTKSIKASLSKYTAALTEDSAIARDYGVSGEQHLFLKYHEYSETDSGEKQKTFNPVGLSGGPLIDLGNFASPERYVERSQQLGYIAGMTIERISKHDVLVATRIQVVLDAIRSHG